MAKKRRDKNCGLNYFVGVVGAGGASDTPQDAEAEADASKNVYWLLAKQVRDINDFHNKPCPGDCKNKTMTRPEVHRVPIRTTLDPKTGNYESYVAHVFWGRVDCH